jgi:predicted TIM-barrel fold metal-dependent hydrolase
MVVDSHVHAFASVSERFPRDVHELYPPELEATAERLLGEMESAGVDRAVLVPVSYHDDYLADCLRRFPDRFAGIGLQPPGEPSAEAYRARRDALGLQGIRLFDLGDPATTDIERLPCFPLLAEFARAGDKLWFYGDGAQMELLERVLFALPELTVVLNHLGYWPSALSVDEHGRPRFSRPYSADNLAAAVRLARFPRTHVLFSGLYAFTRRPWPYNDLRPVTTALLEAFGPGRLLLATDFPWTAAEPGYLETVQTLDAQFPDLPAAERSLIRGATAADLFGF